MNDTIKKLRSVPARSSSAKPRLIDALNNYRKNPKIYDRQLTEVIETIADFVISRVPYNLKTLSEDAADLVKNETIAFGWQKVHKIRVDADNKEAFNFLRIHMYHFAKKLTFKNVDRVKQETELHIDYLDWSSSANPSYSMDSINGLIGDTELIQLVEHYLNQGSNNKTKLTKQDHLNIRKTLKLTNEQYQTRLRNLESQLTGEPV